MIVENHIHGLRIVPAKVPNVQCTKIRDNDGNLLVLAIQLPGSVFVTTSADPDFETVAKQYGIPAVAAKVCPKP